DDCIGGETREPVRLGELLDILRGAPRKMAKVSRDAGEPAIGETLRNPRVKPVERLDQAFRLQRPVRWGRDVKGKASRHRTPPAPGQSRRRSLIDVFARVRSST